MKITPWFLAGLLLALIGGSAFFLMGILRLGSVEATTPPEGGAKPMLADAKKKLESLQARMKKQEETTKGDFGFQGSEGEHRVFVSSQLVYLPDNPEPVQPLDRKMKTDDGIEVGWKIKFGFDPSDPGIRDQDPDGDGFTNLEEYSASPSTDPLRKEDSPAKESKLKSRAMDPVPLTISFSEKSGGSFTVRFQLAAKRKEFKGKPGEQCWVLSGPETLEIFTDETKAQTARKKAKESGLCDHLIPVRFVSYLEKIEKIKDASAGGIEVDADNSEIVLERQDGMAEKTRLLFSTPQRPRTLVWDVGDVRFFSPVSGVGEIGPYHLGQTFEYEGKKFVLVGREGKKIKLRNQSDPGDKAFWVPPEVTPPPVPGA